MKKRLALVMIFSMVIISFFINPVRADAASPEEKLKDKLLKNAWETTHAEDETSITKGYAIWKLYNTMIGLGYKEDADKRFHTLEASGFKRVKAKNEAQKTAVNWYLTHVEKEK